MCHATDYEHLGPTMSPYHIHFHEGAADIPIAGLDCADCRPKPHDYVPRLYGSACLMCDRLPGDEVHQVPEWVRRANEHRLTDQRPDES
jgi:hypothetical protein